MKVINQLKEGEMKVSNKDNPFNVQVGQKWKSKDSRRKRKFVIVQFKKWRTGYFAVVDYGDLQTEISLKRFGKYVMCK